MYRIKQVTKIAHFLIKPLISEGDSVVDATAGNGYDTVFLAENVGLLGHVYAFDIQEKALNATLDRLKEKSLEKRVSLYLAGHENMSQFITEQVSVVMYNLGYLPGGSHDITTKYQTTLESIKQGLNLLQPGGIMSIVLYPGHYEGSIEKENLLQYFKFLPASDYTVALYNLINQQHDPPELVMIQKKTFS